MLRACFSSHIVLLLVTALVLHSNAPAQRKLPLLIQYQSKLLSGSIPITSSQKVKIRIFQSESGMTGGEKSLYSETHVVHPDAEGNFSLLIGEKPDGGQKFNPDVFLSPANLFIEVTRIVGNKQEVLSPRQQIVSLAFALQSMREQKVAEATKADEAMHAQKAEEGLRANEAQKASFAEKASVADRALQSDNASRASNADHAVKADHATNATSAERASKADEASHALKADQSTFSEKAAVADRAVKADNATQAERATLADKSLSSDHAQKATEAERANTAEHATRAKQADHADNATTADKTAHADEAAHALRADKASVAESATSADHAKKSDEATKADRASIADKASVADKSTHAEKASHADHATTADDANTATLANEAINARRAIRSDTSMNAHKLGGFSADDFVTHPIQKDDLPAEVVTSKSIATNAITTTHIKDASITGAKIAKGSLSGDLFKDGSIPQSKLQPLQTAKKLRAPGQDQKIDSVDVTGNLSVSGNLFHRFGTLYTPLIRSDGYIFSRFMSAEGVLFALKGVVSGSNGNAVEGAVQSQIGSSFLASGFGDFFRGQKYPQIASDPITFRISNRADIEIRNRANQLIYSFNADSTQPTIKLGGQQSSGTMIVTNAQGGEGIHLTGGEGTNNAMLNVQGTIQVRGKELEVHDYAEVFALHQKEELHSGEVVVIDESQPGRLKKSSIEYDARVAGVISGGDASVPGVLLGVRADGSNDKPVALAGRVYCYADATLAEIHVGDLLTTSSTPGHAMKASDPHRSRGAVIGKAMEGLRNGKGRIMILVTLQ